MFLCLIILYYTTRSQQLLPLTLLWCQRKDQMVRWNFFCLVLGINEEQNHNQSDSAVAVRPGLGLGGLGV